MDFKLTLCYLLLRIVVPLTFLAAVIFRQNLLSFLYLLLLLILPILPSPTPENVIKGINGIYLKVNIGISSLACLAHIVMQIVLLTAFNYTDSVDYCSLNGQLLNLIGLHRLNGVSFFNIIRLCCLDFCILLINVLVYIFSTRTYQSRLLANRDGANNADNSSPFMESLIREPFVDYKQMQAKKRRQKAQRVSYYLNECIFFMALCASAILEPSLISAVYFLYFLFIGSWFALNRTFGTGYHYFRIFIALFVSIHFTLVFLYQFLIIRPLLPSDNINARLFGFVEYTQLNCHNARDFNLNNYHFIRFFHPIVLLMLYFVSINLIRMVLVNKKLSWLVRRNENDDINVDRFNEPLMHGCEQEQEQKQFSQSVHMNYLFENTNINDNTPLLQTVRNNNIRSYHSVVIHDKPRSNSDDNHGRFNNNVGTIFNVGHSIMSTSLPTNVLPPTPNTANLKSPGSRDTNQFSLFCFQLINMVQHGSYVITLIVMMTWSITYHSWLSFVLLLSSCIIWMTPNSRQTCLNSSPILVLYAIMLVIGQYVYSLNLTDNELPVTVNSISISEIGFKKYGEFSYQPLFIKIFYTMFFWVTLRQYSSSLKEPIDSPESPSVGRLASLFALRPRAFSQIQVDMNPALFEQNNNQFSTQSQIFDSMIKCIKGILLKYWIWIVASMLMVMSLSGSKVVIYRIVYMFFFLVFTQLFLISLNWWRKLIYPFWLIVILYSMIILIAIYTYQFNNFPEYWEKYLFVDKELQEDLGLVVYDNDAFVLFKELLTPTFFIIITIIQVHFVHKDFLEFSNIDEILNRLQNASNSCSISMDMSDRNIGSSKASLDPLAEVAELKSQPSQSELSVQTVISKRIPPNDSLEQKIANAESKQSIQKPTFVQEMGKIFNKIYSSIIQFIEQWMIVLWRLLEVHIMKFVFLCTIMIAIGDISVINVIFIFLSIILMLFNKFENIICFIFSIWAGLLVLLKMLFQLNIAQRIDWHTNCTFDGNKTEIIDNRIYIGFLKTDDIFFYIWEYIVLIIILVFRTVILLRQYLYRNQEYGGRPLLEGVIFLDVDRTMADKDVTNFLKYLLNYGFYKFGVEICLILLTISIGNHGDIFSVFYCIFLIAFVLFNREECKRFWVYFVGFMAIVIPYQYLMCLGIPPGLCIEYPWKNIPYYDLEWYFLPNFQHQLSKNKLYLDLILFFFLCRQLLYFRLEPELMKYGGSNIEAYKETTPRNLFDFFSFGTSIFDSIKSYFLFCFFWITLAILFLAGTTRINLFGLGYVLGSFIFLWNGNEFYLKPIKMIFRFWKLIIGYTCIAMLFKSIIQVFILTLLRHNACWLVQLMGISYDHKRTIDHNIKDLLDKCPTIEAGLLWDGICFTFLLIQKRIFCSHYFKYLIREIKAQQFLASRGAELIHEIQAQEVSEQEIAEREVMEKIKQKMDRIKEAQQKMFANKARSINKHKQDEYDYDISPYSAVDETLSQATEPDDLLSQTLPTVYSPTPSIPTITSPQSATTLQPGYFEIYHVQPIKSIDASSSSNTFASFSFASTPMDPTKNLTVKKLASNITNGKSDQSSSPSNSNLQVSPTFSQKIANKFQLTRKLSHASSVKSGGYYMFEELDTEVCDLNYNTRESLIPDPEGDEIKNLAKSKGLSAFCAKIFKGEFDQPEVAIASAETSDVGESSKDSAIISVERPKYNPDASLPTMETFLPKTSQDNTDISETITSFSGMENFPDLAAKDSNEFSKVQSTKDIQLKVPIQPKEEKEKVEEETYLEKIKIWFDFIKKFTESVFISSTSNLNSVSRDYRFVAKRLAVEKKCLKKIIEIKELEGIKHDLISDQDWKKGTLTKLSKLTEEKLENVSKSGPQDVLPVWNELDGTSIEGNKHLYLVSLDPKYMETSIYIHFFRAIFYAILSRSEIICYITIVINQITSASILSLPLPLMAFLWGSLSVPRPSKSFWVTCITYIEVVVVLKYVFQFHFWPWIDEPKPSPLWWPRLLGMEKKDNYANYDLLLLLVLFFHRFMLKSLGLWDLSETEIKAYMTNAEIFQSRNEDKKLHSAGSHGRKHGKKKRSKKDQLTQVFSEGNIQDNSSTQPPSALQPPIPAPISLLNNEEDLSSINNNNNTNNENDVEMEFNCIYLLMEMPGKVKKRFLNSLVKPVYKFFHNVLHPPYRITHDVYSLMFLCDFINFFILVFGFYAFGSGYSGSEDVARFLEENKIPIGFLITLLIQFAQIIIDRAIYLRKYIKGKLIFTIIIVIFTHLWLFFVLPGMTDKAFTDKTNLPPKLWYIFKCIYFLLSAYQIRSGYPTRILGNTFCKKYNFVNSYLFKIYMLIPFVYDLRMYMDWIWTDTSMALDEWSLMEDIFVNLYTRKCELKWEEEFPEPRGKGKKGFFKHMLGGLWVALIIVLIWGPLMLFAFGRAVGEVNPPIGATFELEIGGYQPLFKMSVADAGLVPINSQKWAKLSSSFVRDPVAQTFISGYDQQDVYLINLNGNSTAVWGISPPSQKILQTKLLSNQIMLNMKLTYYLTRNKTKNQDMETTIYDEYLIELHPQRDYELRKKLAEMISQNEKQTPAVIPLIFPNYLRAPEKGKPIVVTELAQKTYPYNISQNYRNLLILLKKGNYENNSSMTSWWEIHDDCQNNAYLDPFLKDLMLTERCQYIPVIVFNDKVFIGLLAFLSGYGIIGIYTTFVFLVSRWVRGFNSESSFKVIYTRMPNVDRVLQLCLDIYLVRESREFELEEDLYAKLIFLYRSPETLIKWTKINEEIHTDNINQYPAGRSN